jgi:transcriptional regulator with XRE-family HTH domain
MATRRVEIGPTGETVRATVRDIRTNRRRLTLRDLSEKMTTVGWPMAHNTISEIERGARRVDVDDLMALAAALETSPLELLGLVEPIHPLSEKATRIVDLVVELDRKAHGDGND